MTRAGAILFALATAELLERLAPDVARRLEPWPDVTARTATDLLHAMESLPAATDRDRNVFLRRTTAQIIEHLSAGGNVSPDGLRIAAYTGPRPDTLR